jgi:hypothetical protein
MQTIGVILTENVLKYKENKEFTEKISYLGSADLKRYINPVNCQNSKQCNCNHSSEKVVISYFIATDVILKNLDAAEVQ